MNKYLLKIGQRLFDRNTFLPNLPTFRVEVLLFALAMLATFQISSGHAPQKTFHCSASPWDWPETNPITMEDTGTDFIKQSKNERQDQSSTTGFIEVGGSKLRYVVQGEGIPCLVIGSSIYYPKTFSPDLYKKLKMYFVDMKWFAEDYKPENLLDVNIASIVQDVEEIREKLGLQNPLILGHSIHGTIAMEYVKKYAKKVRGLIIVGSPAEWGNTTYEEKAAALWLTASSERKALQEQNWGKVKELDRLTGQEEASARYNNMSPQYWYNPSYDAGWLWDGMTVHSEVTQHLFSKVFFNYNMFEPEVSIPVPVFVALGKYDYVIPYTLWKSSYESIPDFTLKHFEKSGHTPQLEEPQRFNQALFDWLTLKKFGSNN